MHPEEIPVWKPFLKRIPLFKDLSDEDLSRIAGLLKPLSLPRGATLFHQGDPGDAFFIITSGQVRLVTERQGRKTVTSFLGRGDTLGELALLSGEQRPMTAHLDATTEFLVLSKRDFSVVLRDNPGIPMQLSRTLSSRVMEQSRGRGEAKALQPQMIGLLALLEGADRVLFVLHFALALVEQSRRRVLLVDLGRKEPLAKALGLEPAVLTEEMFRGRDLHDPSIIGEFVQVHASGLGILTIPPGVLSGRFFRSIFLFMNLLRERSDFAVLSLGPELGDVEKSVLNEADRWMMAGSAAQRDAFLRLRSELDRFVPEPKKMLDVWVGEDSPPKFVHAAGREWARVIWPPSVGSAYRSGMSLFQAVNRSSKAKFGVESLARRVARMRLGLALGTGAALGYSLVGILKALKRASIPVDLVAGTSMGSVIGGFYSLGIEPEEIERVIRGVDKAWVWENLFWDLTLPRSGFFAGTTLLRFLSSIFEDKEFHELERQFSCVACDIETGEEVVFKEGRVAEAVRGSCGIPIIFQPFHYQGRFLVDGGLVDPVPVRIVRQMGADVVVSVNLTMPTAERKSAKGGAKSAAPAGGIDITRLKDLTLPEALKAPNVFQVFFQMIHTMEYEIAKSRGPLADVYIHPDLSDFSWTEFHRGRELIDAGEAVARPMIPKIRSLLPFFADSCKTNLKRSPWLG